MLVPFSFKYTLEFIVEILTNEEKYSEYQQHFSHLRPHLTKLVELQLQMEESERRNPNTNNYAELEGIYEKNTELGIDISEFDAMLAELVWFEENDYDNLSDIIYDPEWIKLTINR